MSNYVNLEFNENSLKQIGGFIKYKYWRVIEDPIDVDNQEGKDIDTLAGLKEAWDDWASGLPREFTLVIGGESYKISENSVHYKAQGIWNGPLGIFDFYYKIPASEDTQKWRKVVLEIKVIVGNSQGGSTLQAGISLINPSI